MLTSQHEECGHDFDLIRKAKYILQRCKIPYPLSPISDDIPAGRKVIGILLLIRKEIKFSAGTLAPAQLDPLYGAPACREAAPPRVPAPARP